MKFNIIHKKELSFTGYFIEVTTENQQHFKDIPSFWQQIMTDGRFQYLLEHSNELGVVGIIYDWKEKTKEFKYMIGVENIIDNNELESITFKEETFAAFEAKGALPNSIQELIPRIYSEWVPTSDYVHSGGPELEVYPKGDGGSEDYISYYWIPVKKKITE